MKPEEVDMKPEEVDQVRKELAESILSGVHIKNPARIRKMAWNMIDESHRTVVKKVTEMFLNDEINQAEYSMMIDIIALVMRKIQTMHT